jgi:hypothetical protein
MGGAIIVNPILFCLITPNINRVVSPPPTYLLFASAHIRLASGMEIGYVVKDASRLEVDPERTAFRARCWLLLRAAGDGGGRGGVYIQ